MKCSLWEISKHAQGWSYTCISFPYSNQHLDIIKSPQYQRQCTQETRRGSDFSWSRFPLQGLVLLACVASLSIIQDVWNISKKIQASMISYPLPHPPWCSNPCVGKNRNCCLHRNHLPQVVDLPSFFGCNHHSKNAPSDQGIWRYDQLWHLWELCDGVGTSTQTLRSS